ncbi:unnamed protein product [Nippostrongylus brasiliensis]|uniref:SEC7 domain-containing protein n=1 Tax=Nippostrongylus brasiliensis TaxID=27835 RepID=A0A0N4YU89_NIPBR|nr:unnamed protein product [Nippostrongylus brasiliensis]
MGAGDSQCPIEEEREAAREAARLFRLEGCTKAEVAERLNDRSEFSAMVTTKYLELFVFTSLRIDAALREFLSRVELHGDSAERERLLRFFSARYHQSDPSLFNSVDDVHTLTCALLLLNSDLHGQNLGKKMSIRDFINNISHTGAHYKRDLLKALYNSIKEHEIVHASKFEKPSKTSPKRSFISRQQLMLEVDPESQVEYKCGYIMRKCVYDADGAKTPFGRRGWREWYARLRGLVLYLGRDDSDKKRSRYEMFNNAILLHHAFAEPAPDYKKKQPPKTTERSKRWAVDKIQRYDTYCHLLRSRMPGGGCEMGGAPSDSTSGVHSKSDIADELDKMSYREAMNH